MAMIKVCHPLPPFAPILRDTPSYANRSPVIRREWFYLQGNGLQVLLDPDSP